MKDVDECEPKPVPEGWGSGAETAADAVSGFVRLALRATTWPAMALPQSLRGGVSRAMRTAIQASGIIPHAVARGVNAFADDFEGSEL